MWTLKQYAHSKVCCLLHILFSQGENGREESRWNKVHFNSKIILIQESRIYRPSFYNLTRQRCSSLHIYYATELCRRKLELCLGQISKVPTSNVAEVKSIRRASWFVSQTIKYIDGQGLSSKISSWQLNIWIRLFNWRDSSFNPKVYWVSDNSLYGLIDLIDLIAERCGLHAHLYFSG